MKREDSLPSVLPFLIHVSIDLKLKDETDTIRRDDKKDLVFFVKEILYKY